MKAVLSALYRAANSGDGAVLASVVATRGSAPRDAGTCMVVEAASTTGTIGGGRLEALVMQTARKLLKDGTSHRQRLSVPLSATAGQCCGGVVELVLECVHSGHTDWLHRASQQCIAGRAWARLVPCAPDDASLPQVYTNQGDAHTSHANADLQPAVKQAFASALLQPFASVLALPGHMLFVYPPPVRHIALFGAGHVGCAMAKTFGNLPVRLSWFDTREEIFPLPCAENVQPIFTDAPEAEVGQLPPGSIVLIMTHSHALDFDLVMALLKRQDMAFIGLIGSRSKRLSFERRLRARSFSSRQLGKITCPIGLPEICGKEPEVIALSVAAQVFGLARPAAPVQRQYPLHYTATDGVAQLAPAAARHRAMAMEHGNFRHA